MLGVFGVRNVAVIVEFNNVGENGEQAFHCTWFIKQNLPVLEANCSNR
jgi:hypothetical protein